MTKLNQIVAIEKGVQARAHEKLTAADRQVSKAPLLSGISRTYQAKDELGDQLPGESTKVQVKADEVVDGVVKELTRHYDVVATKDATNQLANADLVVDGTTLAEGLSISFLLWLGRELVGLHTFIKRMPTLDPADDWVRDQGVWKTAPVETTRTKKVPRNNVKAWPTKEHPNIVPQVEVLFEDVVVGTWKTVKFSGAMDTDRAALLLDRVETLQAAVKSAVQEANSTEVIDVKPGKAIFDYLLAG